MIRILGNTPSGTRQARTPRCEQILFAGRVTWTGKAEDVKERERERERKTRKLKRKPAGSHWLRRPEDADLYLAQRPSVRRQWAKLYPATPASRLLPYEVDFLPLCGSVALRTRR